MTPIKHPLCNGELGSPAGSPHIPKVHVQRYDFEDVPITASFWKPNAVELAELNEGGCIALHVMGVTHAPVGVRVEPNANAESMELKNGTTVDLRAPWPFPAESEGGEV